MEGLIDLFPRRGSYVTTLTKQDAWEVYTLRASLEGLAFKLVPERTPKDEISSLQSIIKQMTECAAAEEQALLSDLDMSFHEEIVRLAKNQRLLSMWLSIIGQIKLLSRRVIRMEYDQYHNLKIVPERHQLLLTMLLEGSEVERVKAIEEHISSVATLVLKRFDETA
jgi:DNA-binding GntR family transcriptional regulator